QLAAAFVNVAEYFADVWPEAPAEAERFVGKGLRRIRNAMLEAVQEQQESEIFLATLADLIGNGRIKVRDWLIHESDGPAREVGHYQYPGRDTPLFNSATRLDGFFILNTSLCLEAVNECLRGQDRPPLAITHKALLNQLRHAGKLLDSGGHPLPRNGRGPVTVQMKLDSGGNIRGFCVAARTLFGGAEQAAPQTP